MTTFPRRRRLNRRQQQPSNRSTLYHGLSNVAIAMACLLLATTSPTCSAFIEQDRSPTTMLQTLGSPTATVPLKWTDFHKHTSNADPPVLFIHGLLGNKRNFASVASSLGAQLDKPRRIFGVDLRNHGESEWHESMSYADMAQDVLDFLDEQNLDQVVLVGHSMGGKVAQALSLIEPSRVAGLVVLDIAPVEYCRHNDPHWKAVVDILHAMQDATEKAVEESGGTATKQDLDKKLREAIPDPALRGFVLTNYGRDGWKIPLPTIIHQLEQLAGFDVSHAAASEQYDGDVFFIQGGQSKFVRHAYLDKIASFFPNHMLTTIRGAGHWVHAGPSILLLLLLLMSTV